MRNLKSKLNSLIALLMALFISLSVSTEISYAVDKDKDDTINYDELYNVITEYFGYCESLFQEKVTTTNYVSADYEYLDLNLDYDTTTATTDVQAIANSRANGLLDYVQSTDITLLSWEATIGKPDNISFSGQNVLTCEVYIWTNFTWVNSDFPEPIESGFGTRHFMSLSFNTQGYKVMLDRYDEQDISGINTAPRPNMDISGVLAECPVSSEDGYINPNALSTNKPTQLIIRSKVVTYANQYVGSYTSGDVTDYTKYNRKYKNYNLGGGDCVNYVSQCLSYAGLPQKSNWTYSENGTSCTNSAHVANNNKSYSTHSCTQNDTSGAAWIETDSFISTMRSAYSAEYKTSPLVADFHIGDVGFLRDGSGSPYHAIICVATGSTTFMINAHNNDRKQVPYNQNTINNLHISRIHIHSPSSSWQKYDSSSHRSPCNSGCGFNYSGVHYAQNPGSNATCLGCGYVGYIPNGIT